MIRQCRVCGKNNRIPVDRLADEGRCGACKASLPAIAEPIVADAGVFDEIVSGARVPVLIDFWAAWCGPCRMAASEVEPVAADMSGRAIVLKVDTEQSPALAQRFNVMSIPNFVVMNNGKILVSIGSKTHDARQRFVQTRFLRSVFGSSDPWTHSGPKRGLFAAYKETGNLPQRRREL